MAQHVRDLMTPSPVTLSPSSTLVEAALAMRDFNVGAIVVVDNGQIYGIATDRDIVIRAIANGNYPATTTLAEVCSRELVTVAPTDTVDDVLCLMRDNAIRRVPVVENGQPVGIVSIGDLASVLKLHPPETERKDIPLHR
jgi:CBS domain-containing protein